MGINETQNRKINKTKSWLFKKKRNWQILARLTKNKERELSKSTKS